MTRNQILRAIGAGLLVAGLLAVFGAALTLISKTVSQKGNTTHGSTSS